MLILCVQVNLWVKNEVKPLIELMQSIQELPGAVLNTHIYNLAVYLSNKISHFCLCLPSPSLTSLTLNPSAQEIFLSLRLPFSPPFISICAEMQHLSR